ncbi:hypothetical protein HY310_01515 [Candidatus Microgenomates bacterium]|nr:hypothetical protein [Candidatus Microgenomates bacterium]
MKVFYTASFTGKEKYQKQYDWVRNAIKANKVELVSPEEGNYLNMLSEKEQLAIVDLKKIHYEAIRRGIEWADAVIIEISQEDFQLGHEATLAIQAQKYVLCLSVNENFSQKIDNRFFKGAQYGELTIDEIVENFLKEAGKNLLSQRFNMFLSASQIQQLEAAAQKYGVNKSEYIRSLIEKDLVS